MYNNNSTQTTETPSSDPWVRTRLCYCEIDAETDCRFHSQSEPGWEQCPNTEAAKASKKVGRWLWGRNPNFRKVSEAAEESLLEEPNETHQ